MAQLTPEAIETINQILKKRGRAVVQGSGKDGIIVMEERRKIIYSAVANGNGEGLTESNCRK